MSVEHDVEARRIPRSSEPSVEERKKLFKRVFSKKARKGETKTEGGKKVHTPGWYDKYPDLSHKQINSVLRHNAELARNATLITYIGAIVEGDLRRLTLRLRTEKLHT